MDSTTVESLPKEEGDKATFKGQKRKEGEEVEEKIKPLTNCWRQKWLCMTVVGYEVVGTFLPKRE